VLRPGDVVSFIRLADHGHVDMTDVQCHLVGQGRSLACKETRLRRKSAPFAGFGETVKRRLRLLSVGRMRHADQVRSVCFREPEGIVDSRFAALGEIDRYEQIFDGHGPSAIPSSYRRNTSTASGTAPTIRCLLQTIKEVACTETTPKELCRRGQLGCACRQGWAPLVPYLSRGPLATVRGRRHHRRRSLGRISELR